MEGSIAVAPPSFDRYGGDLIAPARLVLLPQLPAAIGDSVKQASAHYLARCDRPRAAAPQPDGHPVPPADPGQPPGDPVPKHQRSLVRPLTRTRDSPREPLAGPCLSADDGLGVEKDTSESLVHAPVRRPYARHSTTHPPTIRTVTS